MGEASYEIDSLNLVSLSFWGYAGDYTANGEQLTSDFDTNNILDKKVQQPYELIEQSWKCISGNILIINVHIKKPDKTFTVSYKLDRTPMKTDGEE